MQPTFNMRSLWHLAGWRVSASLALALTAAATFSETGSRRLLLAFGGADAGVQSEQVSVRSRDPDPAAVMAPLVESVRTLTAERDRLAVRISNIERHLDDLTGSIKAQLAASPPGAARTLPQPSPESVGAPGAGSAPQATAPASPDASRPGIEPAANRSEALLGTPSAAERLSSDAFNIEYGIDIGGAANFEGLRQLWTATKTSNASLLEGLYGVVALRENSRTKAAELRLIAGPFADPEAANRPCAALTRARRYCHPAGFGDNALQIPRRRASAEQHLRRYRAALPCSVFSSKQRRTR